MRGISPAQARQAGAEGVSLRDRMWALALLEQELWNRWIGKILSEDSPRLDRIPDPDLFRRASQIEGDHREALRVFGMFRGRNVRLLRQASAKEWTKEGLLDSGRPLLLADIPAAMVRMDQRYQSKLLAPVPPSEPRRPSQSGVLVGYCA